MLAAKKAKLLAGIFCEAPTSFDEAGRPLEEVLVFEAAVPFGAVTVLRWVMGLTPEAQALVGVDFLREVIRTKVWA